MISELPFILEGVLLPTVGTLGLMGNIASVAVLRSRWIVSSNTVGQKWCRKVELTPSFCQLLIMLAVFDSILVVSASISFSLPLISQHWNLVTSAGHVDIVSLFLINFCVSTFPPWYSPTWCPWSRSPWAVPSGRWWRWPGRGSPPSLPRTGPARTRLRSPVVAVACC